MGGRAAPGRPAAAPAPTPAPAQPHRYLADSHLGKHRTIVIFSVFYTAGLFLLSTGAFLCSAAHGLALSITNLVCRRGLGQACGRWVSARGQV